MAKSSAGRKARERGDITTLEQLRKKRAERDDRQEKRRYERQQAQLNAQEKRKKSVNAMGISDVVERFDRRVPR